MARIQTPGRVRGTQDIFGEEQRRFAHVLDTFERCTVDIRRLLEVVARRKSTNKGDRVLFLELVAQMETEYRKVKSRLEELAPRAAKTPPKSGEVGGLLAPVSPFRSAFARELDLAREVAGPSTESGRDILIREEAVSPTRVGEDGGRGGGKVADLRLVL